MKKKISPFLIVIFIIILIGVFVFLIVGQRNFVLRSPEEKLRNEENKEVKITDKKITEKTSLEEIEITYPEIEGQDGFNLEAEKNIKTILDEFKEHSSPDNIGPRPYVLNVGYEKGEVSQDTISIIFTVQTYTGGVHGNTFFSSVNYNTKNNKPINLSDLFFNNSDYLKTISDFSIKDLTVQQKEKFGEANAEWILDGAGPKEENFSSFLINKDNIVFYFPPYQVASYAAGYFKATMPR